MVVFSTLLQDDLVRLTVRMWDIWRARQKVIHESYFQSPLLTHCFVEKWFLDDLELSKLGPVLEERIIQEKVPR